MNEAMEAAIKACRANDGISVKWNEQVEKTIRAFLEAVDVEELARAICKASGQIPDVGLLGDDEYRCWHDYVKQAQAILVHLKTIVEKT